MTKPMLNIIWSCIVIASVIAAVLLGNGDDLSAVFVDSAADAVSLLLQLAGIIGLWSGLMKIAAQSGMNALFAKVFALPLRRLFPRLERNSTAFETITMNISANLLGLGNTATPLGLRAMRELRLRSASDRASDEMVLFVVMNTASLQLLPTTLASLRQSYGSAAPFDILVPVWISSAGALAVALVIAVAGNQISGSSSIRVSVPDTV